MTLRSLGNPFVRVRRRGMELAGEATAVVGDPKLRERYVARFPLAERSLASDPDPVFVRITDVRPADDN